MCQWKAFILVILFSIYNLQFAPQNLTQVVYDLPERKR